jgi:transposase
MRLTASSKTINQIKEKSKLAKLAGNKIMMQKTQVILMISAGLTFKSISDFCGISEESIRLWLKQFLVRKFNFLKQGKSPGRPPALTKSQKKALLHMIDQGPEKNGFTEGGWTCAMIQILIEKKFNVIYSSFYISSLMKNMGYSHQKAANISDKRNEEYRNIWLSKTWPEILKEAEEKNGLIFFGDEVSFSQSGTLSYTWAKKGSQPYIKTSGSKKSIKVFGVIEYFTGKFFSKIWDGKLNSDSYAEFVKEIMMKTKKHIFLIQDGAKYHTSDELEEVFCQNADRITVRQLPACSPDFNPIELLWRKMKNKGTHLKYFPTFESLISKVEELTNYFAKTKEDILPLFGFYEKLNFYNSFKVAI